MKKRMFALSLLAMMVLSAGGAFANDGHDKDDDEHEHGHDLRPAVMQNI